jgi:hypothetical protein
MLGKGIQPLFYPVFLLKKKKNECQQTECLNRAPGHWERQKRKRERKEKKLKKATNLKPFWLKRIGWGTE